MTDLGDDWAGLRFSGDIMLQTIILSRRLARIEANATSDAWLVPSNVRLAAGEMTAQEMRTAQAVASGIASAIRSLAAIPPRASDADTREALTLNEIKKLTYRCPHQGGFDRENGPDGCSLGGDCVCIGIVNGAHDAISSLAALAASSDKEPTP